MAVEPLGFKRIVVGLQPSTHSRTMRLAVELANLLQLELLGLFLEDMSLRDLARMPFAREFRLPGGGWQPIDLVRLSQDLEVAAGSVKRRFTDAVKGLPTKWQFEAVRNPTFATMASMFRTSDIVMIAEPQSPVERATQQFTSLTEAAFQSAAAVMLVPARIARGIGPVVVIAAASDDPSIEAAASIAIAAEEDLIIIAARADVAIDARIRQLTSDTGLTIKHLGVGDISLFDSATFLSAFGQLQERLVVITRGVFDDAAVLAIVSTRRAPVLIIEPPETEQAPLDESSGELLTPDVAAG